MNLSTPSIHCTPQRFHLLAVVRSLVFAKKLEHEAELWGKRFVIVPNVDRSIDPYMYLQLVIYLSLPAYAVQYIRCVKYRKHSKRTEYKISNYMTQENI